MHAVLITFLQANLRVPAIAFNLAKELAVFDHARTAGSAMFQLDETAVAIARFQIWPVGRQDMRVDVDGQRRTGMCMRAHHFTASLLTAGATVPQCLQVRAASLAR